MSRRPRPVVPRRRRLRRGAAVLDERRPPLSAAGIELADSVTIDPHKWLFQPLEAGCLLVRDGAALRRTFATEPAYLRDAAANGDEVNFAERGIQLTRQFNALKLWLSLKVFGAAAFREAIEHGIALASTPRPCSMSIRPGRS